MKFIVIWMLGIACVDKGQDGNSEIDLEPCATSSDCNNTHHCLEEYCVPKSDFGEECKTFDACKLGAFCLITTPSTDVGTCYRIPDECYSGCFCHPEGQESPLCESMVECVDSESTTSYLLTCENDTSPPQLEGLWLDNGRISDGPQCSMRAYVIPEEGEVPEGCPNCDIAFNARLDFYRDTCGFLSNNTINNGIYYPFGLSGDRLYLYTNGRWEESEIYSSSRERGWRSFYSFEGYWEDIAGVSYFHNITFEVTW